jgi:3-oxoacyl-[acyl-carrier protein] reductase
VATFPAGCTLLFGGSGGIGQGVARTFANAGSDVAIVYRSKREAAEQVASYARTAGRKATVHSADVTDLAQVGSAIDAAIAEHGRIHSVVWAAGPLVNQRYLADTPAEEWRHAFDVEVHGFFAVVQAVIPHMREAGGGSFVTLGSAGHGMGCPSR